MSDRVIAGRRDIQLVPRLLSLISHSDEVELRCDIFRGPKGELAVRTTAGEGDFFQPDGPCHWTTATIAHGRVETKDGLVFEIEDARSQAGILELVAALWEREADAPSEWRRNVLFALPDASTLGRVVRRLLAHERNNMRYLRTKSDPHGRPVHPGHDILLHVHDAPLIVILEALDEGFGRVFYNAPNSEHPDRKTGIYLPWGRRYSLLDSARLRVDGPHLFRHDGSVTTLPLGAFDDIFGVLDPVPLGTVEAIEPMESSDVRFEVPLRLEPLDTRHESGQSTPELWMVPPREIENWQSALYLTAEDRLTDLEAQLVKLGDDQETFLFVLNPRGSDRRDPLQLTTFDGVRSFSRGSGKLRTLYLPWGWGLLPKLEPESLSPVFSLSRDVLTILAHDENRPGRMRIFRLRRSGFEPLREAFVEYTLKAQEQRVEQLLGLAEFDFGDPVVITPWLDQDSLKPSSRPGRGASRASKTRHPRRPPPIPSEARIKQIREETLQEPSEPLGLDLGVALDASRTEAAENTLTPAEHLASLTEAMVESFDRVEAKDWHLLARATSALRRPADAHCSFVHLLFSVQPRSARQLLADHLFLRTSEALHHARDRLASWVDDAHRDESWLVVANHVMTTVLDISQGTAVMAEGRNRHALTELGRSVRKLNDPYLAWLYCRAAASALRDRQIVEAMRLHTQSLLRDLHLEQCLPLALVEEIGRRAALQMIHSTEQFVARFSPAPSARLWIYLLLALHWARARVPLTGPVHVETLRSELTTIRESITEENASRAEELIDVLERVQRCERCRAGSCDWSEHVDMQDGQSFVRALLVEEGIVHPPGATELESARLRRELEERLDGSDEEVSHALESVWREATRQPENFVVLLEAIEPLWRRHDEAALRHLGNLISNYRRSFPDPPPIEGDDGVMRLLADVGLLTLSMRRDPNTEVTQQVLGLVSQLRDLPSWDREPIALHLLSSLGELPSEARMGIVELVTETLLEIDTVRAFSQEQILNLRQTRILSRIVGLLKVTPEQTHEGNHVRRVQWNRLRATVAREYRAFSQGEPLL